MSEQTEREKLEAKFKQLQSQGLVHVGFYLTNLEEATHENVYREVNQVIEAFESGRCRSLRFNDSHREKP